MKVEKLLLSGKEWCKFKIEERAVIMLVSYYYLALLVDRVHRIMVIMYYVMYIFLGHYPCQEYDEHKPTQ